MPVLAVDLVIANHVVATTVAVGDRLRARRIQRFLSQNTYVAKQFTGIEGSTVPVSETIEAFNKICDGEYDDVAEQAFFMCGGLEDVERKWADIKKDL